MGILNDFRIFFRKGGANTLAAPPPTMSENAFLELRLAAELFVNMRIVSVALLASIGVYYFLLSFELQFQVIREPLVLHFAITAGASLFFFFGERWVNAVKQRLIIANAAIFVIAAVYGSFFSHFYLLITNGALLVILFTFFVGMLGAAAPVLGAGRWSFIIFAVGWSTPRLIPALFIEKEFMPRILAGLNIFYVLNLYILSKLDYNRRQDLIRGEFRLHNEKNKLQDSLAQISELKSQQDGDYYLTSLLLKPLAAAHTIQTENVTIEFFSEQKKKFVFKKHQSDIGGDINIAHEITLRDEPCVIFLNADAMGKSMQGAGGALVMGAVFQSIIQRTKLKKEYQRLFPERWLKNAVVEIQRVFESFDGSMLVSAFMGIIECRNGMVYYVNAEHPEGVLYRNGVASFLESRQFLFKLGSPGIQRRIHVDCVHLEKDDKLIIGTDGRDDIDLKAHKHDKMRMNNDENLFLRYVERAQGDPRGIYREIASSGEITDDLSLAVLTYSGVGNEDSELGSDAVVVPDLRRVSELIAERRFVHAGETLEILAARHALTHPKILKRVFYLCLKCKNYHLASRFAVQVMQQNPASIEIIYLAAVSQKKIGNYEFAIDLGERIHLRDPANERNLRTLKEAYSVQGNHERAAEIDQELRTLGLR